MTETTNATKQPTSNKPISIAEIPAPTRKNLRSFKALAPNITGIARKNVNSAATYLDTPKSRPPMIVAPERDVPGIKEST